MPAHDAYHVHVSQSFLVLVCHGHTTTFRLLYENMKIHKEHIWNTLEPCAKGSYCWVMAVEPEIYHDIDNLQFHVEPYKCDTRTHLFPQKKGRIKELKHNHPHLRSSQRLSHSTPTRGLSVIILSGHFLRLQGLQPQAQWLQL